MSLEILKNSDWIQVRVSHGQLCKDEATVSFNEEHNPAILHWNGNDYLIIELNDGLDNMVLRAIV